MPTKIEWTEETWNPSSGCTKVGPDCKNCYAERLWPKVAAAEAAREGSTDIRPFTHVMVHRDRLDKPLHWKRPRRVFVDSMSDLFHEDIEDGFIDEVFAVMAQCPQHTFQILTKRHRRMREYVNTGARVFEVRRHLRHNWNPRWPLPNVWLGVSAGDQGLAQERVPDLWSALAAVRFISWEPALGQMNPSVISIPAKDVVLNDGRHEIHPDALQMAQRGMEVHLYDLGGIDWVIAGMESGPRARTVDLDVFEWCRQDCQRGGVAFFMKQICERGRKIDYALFPQNLQVRQYPAPVVAQPAGA